MTPPARPFRLGLLQYPVERPAGVAAFAAKLDHWLAEARGQADLVMLPEYACVELGAALAGTEAPDEAAELRAMVDHAAAWIDPKREDFDKTVRSLLPGLKKGG